MFTMFVLQMKSFTIALIALFACIGASLGYNYGYMPYTPTSGMGNNGLCKYCFV